MRPRSASSTKKKGIPIKEESPGKKPRNGAAVSQHAQAPIILLSPQATEPLGKRNRPSDDDDESSSDSEDPEPSPPRHHKNWTHGFFNPNHCVDALRRLMIGGGDGTGVHKRGIQMCAAADI